MRKIGFFWLACPLLIACAPFLRAADESSPEDFKIELTGSAWLVNSSGQIQANGAPVDLVHDLGVGQNQPTFYGKLVFKPGRRHRIVVEGTPFALSGYNTVDRAVVYRGQTFDVSQTLQSSASLNYLFAGYQYDVLSNRMGHLGFSVGGAYLDATGTLQAIQTGTTATKTETVGLPLAGADFRIFPIPGHPILEFNGEARGMAFGSYGHYVQSTANGGVKLGHLLIEAGYRAVVADLHESSANQSGIFVHLHGPIFSLVFHY